MRKSLRSFYYHEKLCVDKSLDFGGIDIGFEGISEEKECQDVMVQMIKSQIAQLVMDTIEEAGYELEAIEFFYPTHSALFMIIIVKTVVQLRML